MKGAFSGFSREMSPCLVMVVCSMLDLSRYANIATTSPYGENAEVLKVLSHSPHHTLAIISPTFGFRTKYHSPP